MSSLGKNTSYFCPLNNNIILIWMGPSAFFVTEITKGHRLYGYLSSQTSPGNSKLQPVSARTSTPPPRIRGPPQRYRYFGDDQTGWQRVCQTTAITTNYHYYYNYAVAWAWFNQLALINVFPSTVKFYQFRIILLYLIVFFSRSLAV